LSWQLRIVIGGVDLKTTLNRILKIPMFYFCAFADYDVTMMWASSQTFHCLKLLLIQFLCKIYLSGAGGTSKMRLVRLRLVRLG